MGVEIPIPIPDTPPWPGRVIPAIEDPFIAGIQGTIRQGIRVGEELLESELVPQTARVARVLVEAYRQQHKAVFFGNGGSAADAQHLAAEMTGKFYRHRPALPALALTVNTSALTAIANDYSYAWVFARQIEALGQPGDVAVGISTSGNSASVIEGMKAARRKSMTTVALTGRTGGMLKDLADFCLLAPTLDPPRIQEVHTFLGHILCEIVEQELFPAC